MSQEEAIKQNLIENFGFLEGKITIPRANRIFVELAYENFAPVFDYAVRKLKFLHLCTITGLDEGESLGFIYHLAADSGVLLNLKTSFPKDKPGFETVTAYFPGAEIYERELMDLLGARIEGLPAGGRYPLTDDWPRGEFPLRKDWGAKTDA